MSPLMWPWSPLNVALRKESVDRNLAITLTGDGLSVALRKESVDRNAEFPQLYKALSRRSPQGERG